MSSFLVREPGEQGWKEITISDQQEVDAFIGEWADSIELGMGINLHMPNLIFNESEGQLINLVVSYSGAAYPIFGNVLLAGTGEEGEPLPLTREQLKFLKASSHFMRMPSGLRLMHLYPGGFHSTQMEPLRILGSILSAGFTTNNHSISNSCL